MSDPPYIGQIWLLGLIVRVVPLGLPVGTRLFLVVPSLGLGLDPLGSPSSNWEVVPIWDNLGTPQHNAKLYIMHDHAIYGFHLAIKL